MGAAAFAHVCAASIENALEMLCSPDKNTNLPVGDQCLLLLLERHGLAPGAR
jgi:hypothetical protein